MTGGTAKEVDGSVPRMSWTSQRHGRTGLAVAKQVFRNN
jgi:hypothetical protein